MNKVLRQIYPVNGSSVELRNCLEEAGDKRRELSAPGRRAIDAALSEGLICVVESHPYFCKSTDAYAGEIVSLAGSFATREEAQNFINARGADGRYEDETSVEILPRVVVKVEAPIVVDDGVPF